MHALPAQRTGDKGRISQKYEVRSQKSEVRLPMKHAISSHGAPKAIGPYSPAIRAGQLLFVSGQVAIDPATG